MRRFRLVSGSVNPEEFGEESVGGVAVLTPICGGGDSGGDDDSSSSDSSNDDGCDHDDYGADSDADSPSTDSGSSD